MAGPVVEVLARTAITRDEAVGLVIAAAQDLDLRVTAPVDDGSDDVATVLLPGGYDLSTWLWPVDRERDADEVALLEQVAGYAPAASLLVVAWSRRPDVARHQADVLIRLAERLDALVALGGLIAPPARRPPLLPAELTCWGVWFGRGDCSPAPTSPCVPGRGCPGSRQLPPRSTGIRPRSC